MLLESAGFVFCHKDFGTTPNMAPPSNLKFPASMGYSVITTIKIKNYLIVSLKTEQAEFCTNLSLPPPNKTLSQLSFSGVPRMRRS